MVNINQGDMLDLLSYDPQNGSFIWNSGGSGRKTSNVEAGCINLLGYRVIRIKRKLYLAHRLAWLAMTGVWPEDEVDHINGCRNDNRWSNLRSASHAENGKNVTASRSNNTSGYKGVTWHPQSRKWRARILHRKKAYQVGMFESIADAAAAYDVAAKKLFGDFARLNNEEEKSS